MKNALKYTLALVLSAAFPGTANAAPVTYEMDPAHTSGDVDRAASILLTSSGSFIGANKKNGFPGTLLLPKR